MKSELICFAEDTTGSLDLGGSLQTIGYEPLVSLEATVEDQHKNSCLIINLDSGYQDYETSRNVLNSVLKQTDNIQSKPYFHKVDSTLRGYVLEDVDTIREHLPERPIIIAPAFPQYGRNCIDGIYRVDQTPITNTVYAQDSSFRHASDMLNGNRQDIQHISWRDLEKGPSAVIDIMQKSGVLTYTFDTRNQSDLEIIGQIGELTNGILVGSSGLARSLPSVAQSHKDRSLIFDATIPSLFIVGSANPLSRKQMQKLTETGLPHIRLNKKDIGNTTKLNAIRRQLEAALDQNKSFCVSSPDTILDSNSAKTDVENSIAEVARVTGPIHNLIVVGGETTRAVFSGRSINKLDIHGEFQAGIPVSGLVSEKNAKIITKAGGFGNDETLINIYNSIYHGRA